MTDLQDKVVLVTGASRGLGRASALTMARAGAQVCALARTIGGLEELDDAIRPGGGNALLIPLDIRDDDGLARLGAALHERHGRVDIWLHTAVYAPPLSPAEHIVPRELDTAWETNVRAFQRLIRVVEPLLRLAPEPRALIAGESSPAGAFHGLYGATKAAQSALVRAWAEEAKSRVTVAEILPPPMATALRARFYPGETRDRLMLTEAVAERLLARLPEARPGARLAL